MLFKTIFIIPFFYKVCMVYLEGTCCNKKKYVILVTEGQVTEGQILFFNVLPKTWYAQIMFEIHISLT